MFARWKRKHLLRCIFSSSSLKMRAVAMTTRARGPNVTTGSKWMQHCEEQQQVAPAQPISVRTELHWTKLHKNLKCVIHCAFCFFLFKFTVVATIPQTCCILYAWISPNSGTDRSVWQVLLWFHVRRNMKTLNISALTQVFRNHYLSEWKKSRQMQSAPSAPPPPVSGEDSLSSGC